MILKNRNRYYYYNFIAHYFLLVLSDSLSWTPEKLFNIEVIIEISSFVYSGGLNSLWAEKNKNSALFLHTKCACQTFLLVQFSDRYLHISCI